ncbi:MAG: hypothetical protein RMI89_06740 [Gloeomargarita sp. SKYBB_i_bin120]|nr:hypothetical protein [Gloeomargarita sp. SKYG98]MCS7292657.1 hypothetical protein [Gloeomargarita sp. SKYB120]MDW8178219.1 hypothetical protein [Gloeomargarita sp. SKYBB_i_bin120]
MNITDFRAACQTWSVGTRPVLELGSLIRTGEDARALMRVIAALWCQNLDLDDSTVTRMAFIYDLLSHWESWSKHQAQECEQVVQGLHLQLQGMGQRTSSQETLDLLIQVLASGISAHIDDMD